MSTEVTGPWLREPNEERWECQGLPCLIRRSDLGALCGYVGLPPGHRHHGAGHALVFARPDQAHPAAPLESEIEIEVHGGLTFSGTIYDGDDTWWLGFDCAHAGDLVPGLLLPGPFPSSEGTYRDIAYVRAEVERLAAQLQGEGGGL